MNCKFLGGPMSRHYLLYPLSPRGNYSVLVSVSNKVLSIRQSYSSGQIEVVWNKIIRQKAVVSGFLKFLNLSKQPDQRQGVIIMGIMVHLKFRKPNWTSYRL